MYSSIYARQRLIRSNTSKWPFPILNHSSQHPDLLFQYVFVYSLFNYLLSRFSILKIYKWFIILFTQLVWQSLNQTLNVYKAELGGNQNAIGIPLSGVKVNGHNEPPTP